MSIESEASRTGARRRLRRLSGALVAVLVLAAGVFTPSAAFAAIPTGYVATSGWTTSGLNATATQIGGTTYLGSVTSSGTNQTVGIDGTWTLDGTVVPRRQFTAAAVTGSATACLNGAPVDTLRECNLPSVKKMTTITFPRAVVNPIIAIGARGALTTLPATGTGTKTFCATSWTDHTVTAISGSSFFSRSQVVPLTIASGQRFSATGSEVYFDPTVMSATANECLVPAAGTGTVSYIQIMGVVDSVQFETRWRSMVTRNNAPVQTTRTSTVPPGWQLQPLFTQADLGITKTATTSTTTSGQIQWQLNVTNKGTGPSHGFQVDDVVPLGVTGVSVVSSPVPCTIGTETIAGVPRQVVHCSAEPPDCVVVPDASTPGWADTLCDTDGELIQPVLASGATLGPIVLQGTAGTTTGTVSNTATVAGNDMDPVRTDNTATATTQVVAAAPAVTLSAAVTPAGPAALTAGTTLAYTFDVTNSGNMPLAAPIVIESAWDGDGPAPVITCPSGAVAVNATVSCTASHTLTQAEIDRGSVSLTGVAYAESAAGEVNSADAVATTQITRSAVLTLVASASVAQLSAVGQTVNYNYLVTNTGNVTLTGVGATESGFTGTGTAPTVSCAPSTLTPGTTTTCTSSYTTVAGDTGLTELSINVSANGVAPTGVTAPATVSAVVLVGLRIPDLSFTKTSTVAAGSTIEFGETVGYTLTATNTGGAALTGVTVIDDLSAVLSGASYNSDAVVLIDGVASGTVTETASGLSWSGSLAAGSVVTITYSVTATTPGATIENNASVTATAPGGVQLAPAAVSVTHQVRAPFASLTLSTEASVSEITAVGQSVTYSYVVTNTGNVTLTDVGVTESAFTGTGTAPAVSCVPTTVAPTASATCTSTYVTVAGDTPLTELSINVAAGGVPPVGVAAPTEAIDVVRVAMRIPAMTFTKTSSVATGSTIGVGDSIAYTLTATNTGGAALTGVTVIDDLSAVLTGASYNDDAVVFVDGVAAGAVTQTASGLSWTGSLAAGSVVTITYSVTSTTFGATVQNDASATATAPGGVQLAPPAVSITHHVRAASASLSLSGASSATELTAVGQTVTYSYVVTNTGNVSLTSVGLAVSGFTGTGPVPVITCAPTVLAPAATSSCSASYTTRPGDAPLTELSISATATGIAPTGVTPPAAANETLRVTMRIPAMTFTKTSSVPSASAIALGTAVPYTLTARNVGGAALSQVTVVDDLSSVLPGATFNNDAVARIAGVDAGAVTVTATGLSWTGSLAAGAAVTLTYSVTAKTAGATLRNAASVTGLAPADVVIAPPAASTTHKIKPAGLPLSPPDGGGGLSVTGAELGSSLVLGQIGLAFALFGAILLGGAKLRGSRRNATRPLG